MMMTDFHNALRIMHHIDRSELDDKGVHLSNTRMG